MIMLQDKMSRGERIALESVAQALSTVNRMRELDNEGFDLAMGRAAEIERFIVDADRREMDRLSERDERQARS